MGPLLILSKNTPLKVSEAEKQWQDFERKLHLTEEELYRTSEKAVKSETQVEELEAKLNEAHIQIESLEAKRTSAETGVEALSTQLKRLLDTLLYFRQNCKHLKSD